MFMWLTVILIAMLIFYLKKRALVQQNLTISWMRSLLCRTNCEGSLQLIVEWRYQWPSNHFWWIVSNAKSVKQHPSARHLCTLLQIYYRMWNLWRHMVSWGRWHITKLSPMPHWKGTTRDNKDPWVGWFSEASHCRTSKFQHGWWVHLSLSALITWSTHHFQCHLIVMFPVSSVYFCISNYSLSAYHFQYHLITSTITL